MHEKEVMLKIYPLGAESGPERIPGKHLKNPEVLHAKGNDEEDVNSCDKDASPERNVEEQVERCGRPNDLCQVCRCNCHLCQQPENVDHPLHSTKEAMSLLGILAGWIPLKAAHIL